MSIEIHIDNLLDWYNEAVKRKIEPLRKIANKKVSKFNELISNFKNACENLLNVEVSVAEQDGISAKSAQRLSQKYIKELDSIKIPEPPYTFENLDKLRKDLQKSINNILILGRKLIPKLNQIYKKEVQEINFYFQNLGNEWNKLNNFLEKKYKDVILIEQVISKIEKINETFKHSAELKHEETELKSKIEKLEDQKSKLIKELNEIKNQKELRRVIELENEFNKLKQNLMGQIGFLRKPFLKFEKIIGNKYQLELEYSKILSRYSQDPFNTFMEEPENYPKLKNILIVLKKALENKDLDLSNIKNQKALSKVNKIINGSLISVQNQLLSIKRELDKISRDPKIEILNKKLKELEDKIEQINTKLTEEKVNLERIEDSYNKSIQKIIDYRTEIIDLIKKTTKKEIKIIFEQE